MQHAAVPGSSVLSTSTWAGEQDMACPVGCTRQGRSGREKKTCCLRYGAWGQAGKMVPMAVLKACDAQV